MEWGYSKEAIAEVSFVDLAARWTQFDWENKGYLTRDEVFNRRA